jgi:glycosyltransferase involved in cell wall biosynthesis
MSDSHRRRLREAAEVTRDRLAEGRLAAAVRPLITAYGVALPEALQRARRHRRRRKDPHPLLGRELRVALLADGISGTDGVTRLVDELRDRGVPGCRVDVIGCDHRCDIRLPAVAELDLPQYPGLPIGLPALPELLDVLCDTAYDVVHLISPGPMGLLGAPLAKAMRRALLITYHTEISQYAGIRQDEAGRADAAKLERDTARALGAWYRSGGMVLSPSRASDDALRGLGVAEEALGRWGRGTDLELFAPEGRTSLEVEGAFKVLYAGRVNAEKGIWLLADAVERAHAQDPRIHLTVCGDGPERGALAERLGSRASVLGFRAGGDYAAVHRSADAFAFCSVTDTYGQVLTEAQASGVPPVAVARGGPLDLVEHDVSGLLVEPDADAVAAGLLALAADPARRERLAAGAARAAASRSWEACFRDLADGYRQLLRLELAARPPRRPAPDAPQAGWNAGSASDGAAWPTSKNGSSAPSSGPMARA